MSKQDKGARRCSPEIVGLKGLLSRFLLFVLVFAGVTPGQRIEPMPPSVSPRVALRPSVLAPPSKRGQFGPAIERRLGPLTQVELNRAPSRAGAETVGVHRVLEGGGIEHNRGSLGRGMIAPVAWTEGTGGSRVWRLAIQSDDAAGLRVHFTDFAIGSGKVWVHGGEADGRSAKVFSDRGPFGDGDFWSPVVFSSSVVVEYEPDASRPMEDAVPFQIKQIAHLWRTPAGRQQPLVGHVGHSFPTSPQQKAVRSPRDFLDQVALAGTVASSVSSNSGVPRESDVRALAAYCQVDISCYPEWSGTSNAVAMIVFETSGGTVTCSGTLLNTRDNSFAPYFLTAAHCIARDSEARTVEAFWSFRSATCNGSAPSLEDLGSTLGARQVKRFGDFEDSRGDFNLLLLDSAPPEGAIFAGWDPNPVALGARVAGIHHPQGEEQRITFGEVLPDNFYGTSSAYMIVHEMEGRTEPGSSGSGVFTQPNVLTGVLSFGPSIPRGSTVCDIDPSYVGYGRFSSFYPEVSGYLEGLESPPPPDADQTLQSGEPLDFSLPAVFFPTLFDDPVFRIDVPENARSLIVNLESVTPTYSDVDLFVRYQQPPEVLNGAVVADYVSESPSSAEQVTVDANTSPALVPGTYYVAFALYTRRTEVAGVVRARLEMQEGSPSEEVPRVDSVVHAATQRSGAIAPGEIVSIYGAYLGPATGLPPALEAGGKIPTSAAGVTVIINGIPAPLFFVRSDQINAQVPYEISGQGDAQVVVYKNGTPSGSLSVQVASSAPGVFMFFDGSQRGIVFNQDSTLNSTSNPADRGQVVFFYVTGEGQTTPESVTGLLTTTLPIPQLPVSVEIGGHAAEVLFAGTPVGYVGLMQVNARVPADSATGSAVDLTVRVGDSTSPSVALSVR